MDVSDYGPFAGVVAVMGFLLATFSLALLKAVGGTEQWAALLEDTPCFLVKTGPRLVAARRVLYAMLVILNTLQTRGVFLCPERPR
jgi:hypothetical protein